MAKIFPFAGYRYSPTRVRLDDVLTQPYDKITPEMQQRYYTRSPYNLIAVEKGRPEPGDNGQSNIYTRAAARLHEWMDAGILVRDPAPGLYAYFQEYTVPGTDQRRLRRGFIALGQLEDYSAGVVFPHERTLTGPKADRLELLRQTRVQTGQLFLLYDDPQRRIDALLDQAARVAAPAEVRDEYDVAHRLWPIVDSDTVERIVAAMADKKLVIADGHHRYETALAYRDECRAARPDAGRNAPHERAMMTLVNARSEGLTILPTHRVVSNLSDFRFGEFRERVEPFFDWYAYPFSSSAERETALAELRGDLERRGRERPALGLHAGEDAFYLFLLRRDADLEELLPGATPAQRRLDVVLLHRLLLERGLGITAEAVEREAHLSYERDAEAAVAAVDAGRAQLACLVNPVRIEQMMEIAEGGDVLPQKSTDFYPKLLSGLVMYRMDG